MARYCQCVRRKRLKRWEVRGFRFLTFSCHRRARLLGRAAWRDVFVESLERARERCGFGLMAWVAMPEHVHLLIVPSEVAVGDVLRSIKQPVAQRAIRRWRETGAGVLDVIRVGPGYRYWQAGGGFDRVVRDQKELEKTFHYIHRNPVVRGLVEKETDWAWSSARWYAGMGGVECDRVVW